MQRRIRALHLTDHRISLLGIGGLTRTAMGAAFLLVTLGTALAAEWRHFSDPAFGYSINLPGRGFAVEAVGAKHGVTLYERGGRGQIDVYASDNLARLELREVRDALSSAERIRDITYTRSGASWFVISGHYRRQEDEAADLIFYAKFMLSADGQSISAFEASYPIADKERYDPIIEEMQRSLTRPLSPSLLPAPP
ncbi:MAG: hypothetical protein ABIQ30_06650 [Devosia sp.]